MSDSGAPTGPNEAADRPDGSPAAQEPSSTADAARAHEDAAREPAEAGGEQGRKAAAADAPAQASPLTPAAPPKPDAAPEPDAAPQTDVAPRSDAAPKPDGAAEPEASGPGSAAGGEAPAGETVHGQPLVESFGAAVVHCGVAAYGELMAALAADGYDLMVGVSGVDYLTHPGRPLPPAIAAERFEVVVELARMADRSRLRVRCQVPDSDPTVPSLFDLWAGSEAHEREVYDMFGIAFAGHPDPSRILMPEDWEGHPLRKDYATGRIPVQFKESPGGR